MWNWPTNQVELILLRHGLTKGNEEKRYIGRSDESLSKKGMEQVQSITLFTEQVFVSPMKRCIETSQIVFPNVHYEIISNFKEIDFGDFEGKNYQELSNNSDYQAWIDSNGTYPFPNGESQKEFITRSILGFEDMVKKIHEERVACVIHGGTIMAILSHYTNTPYFDYQVKNGEGYICTLTMDQTIKISNIRRLV